MAESISLGDDVFGGRVVQSIRDNGGYHPDGQRTRDGMASCSNCACTHVF